jgi:hypothetical protein
MANDVVVNKDPNLLVGKIYRGLRRGPWGPAPDQCFRVVKKSTEEAWIECLVSYHGEKEREWLEILVRIGEPWYYYEIQTD